MKNRKGQSAAELAIFGVVLIFVIGLILRSGLSASQQMDVRLRAMRMALAESYKTSQAAYGASAALSRNSAMVMLVEDRLSVDASKTGTRDRIPNVAVGRGTLTNRLYEKFDFSEQGNLPIFDVIINGQRFPFTQAGLKSYYLVPDTHEQCQGVDFSANESRDRRVVRGDREYICLPACPQEGAPHMNVNSRQWYPGGTCWAASCSIRNPPPPQNQPPPPAIRAGCPVFYRRMVNSPVAEDSGDAVGRRNRFCMAAVDDDGNCADGNLKVNQRFDLDFDGASDVSDAVAKGELRRDFAWQWVMVAGMLSQIPDQNGNPTSEFTQNELGAGVYPVDPWNTGENMSVDVDGDSKEEVILSYGASTQTGVLERVDVIDRQEGDLDFTKDDGDHERERVKAEVTGDDYQGIIDVGVQEQIRMYSKTNVGTYLRVEEGKLFDNDNQFVRSTTRQDQLDLIERYFRISNDTDRFCGNNGQPRDWRRDPPPGVASQSSLIPSLVNPIEACNDCLADANKRDKTCLEEVGKVLIIRSRIKDVRGRRWVTRVDAP